MRIAIVLSLFSVTAFAQVDAKTTRAWKAKCSACHGDDGRGATDAGKKLGVTDMTVAAWQKSVTDAQMTSAITKGIKEKRAGKDVEMPAFADLTPPQVDALVKLVRGLGK